MEEYKNDYDKTYFNLIVPGPTWNSTTQKYNSIITPTIQTAFNQPIIDVPEDYYLTVLRLSIPTGNIPLHILEPEIMGGNDLIYIVTLEYNGNSSSVNLVWNPSNETDPTNVYYYSIYRYGEMVSIINKAFTQAFNNISPPVNSKPPFITYNPDKQKFVMYAQANYYCVDENGDTASPAINAIKIFINAPLQPFFDGMSELFIDYKYQILMMDLNGMNWSNPSNVYPPTSPEYIYNEQQFISLALINSMKSIQIMSNTLPIKKEYVPLFNQNRITGSVSAVGILKDFIPIQEGGENLRTYINFINEGPYQLINMTGRTPINKIDIEVRWTDKNGKSYPVEIPYDQTVSIRFGFFKKKTFMGS